MIRAVASAPGRVNLIGEHTDYNEGFVLPVAIDLRLAVSASRRDDRSVRIRSLDLARESAFPLDGIAHVPDEPWSHYARGVLLELMREGVGIPGMDLAVSSKIPPGAGLSSSAAFEMAVALVAVALGSKTRSPEPGIRNQGPGSRDLEPGTRRLSMGDLARLCWKAENEFVGVPCGIMDPTVCALGQEGAALLLDCRSGASRPVPLAPLGDVRILVADTGVRHRLADGAHSPYADRRRSCEEGVRILREAGETARSLRDATLPMLSRNRARLGETVYRRCRYVVEENARVLAAVEAIAGGDVGGLGRLLRASHEGLRDLFEASHPALDALAEAAWAFPGCVGSRMTGAGFGGCTVSLVQESEAEAFAALMRKAGAVSVRTCRPSGGACLI